MSIVKKSANPVVKRTAENTSAAYRIVKSTSISILNP